MKVLHITTSVVEQSASYRIHKALLKNGIDSWVYVLNNNNTVSDDHIIFGNKKSSTVLRLMHRIKKTIRHFFERIAVKLFTKDIITPVSFAICTNLDKEFIKTVNPDIINLHWICGEFLSVEDMKFLAQYKVVWTLHDSWGFTGGCHIPYDCEKYKVYCKECPQVNKKCGVDLIKSTFERKIRIYKSVGIDIVTPSKWLSSCTSKSVVFSDKTVNTIPNPIDIKKFKPIDKNIAREILNLPQDKKIILFGAVSATSDSNKGFLYLQQAILKLYEYNTSDEIQIVVFGANRPENAPNFGFSTKYMGRINDDITLSIIYNCADVVVVPSKSENFPNVVLESLACGVPVVAFRIGGLIDQVDHKLNGYLAEPFDTIDLAKGIEYVINNDNYEKMSLCARDKVVKNYSEEDIAKRYMFLFSTIMEKKRGYK